MADSTNVTIRMDSDIKKDAEELFNGLGLNMTTAVNMFIRRSLVEGGIPFDVKRKQPNPSSIAAMEEVTQGKNLIGPFHSVADLMEDLDA